MRGPKYVNHHSATSCPYTDSRLDYELPDRLGHLVRDENTESLNEGLDTQMSNSPSPSDGYLSIGKSKQTGLGNVSRKWTMKRKACDNPGSPSTNSESKLSRPSTPSSLTNMSALHQSIYSMRMQQQQQEPPIGWDRHCKLVFPVREAIKPLEALTWSYEKVSQFVDSIPGCQNMGRVFQEEVRYSKIFLFLTKFCFL